MMKIKKGFTLIELLVVISIIAVLMAIMMPALGRVREQAKMVICQTNLKQYGVGGNMYLTENDGRFPFAWNGLYSGAALADKLSVIKDAEYPTSTACIWHDPDYNLQRHPEMGGPLWAYLSNTKVHVCPIMAKLAKQHFVATEHAVFGWTHNNAIPINELNFSYSQNANLGADSSYSPGHGDPGAGVLKISQVKRPGELVYFVEENTWTTTVGSNPTTTAMNDNAFVPTWSYNRSKSPTDPTQRIYPDMFATFHKTRAIKKTFDSFDDKDMGVADAVFIDGSVRTVHPRDTLKYSVATR